MRVRVRNINMGAAISIKAHDRITTSQCGVVGMATPLINMI